MAALDMSVDAVVESDRNRRHLLEGLSAALLRQAALIKVGHRFDRRPGGRQRSGSRLQMQMRPAVGGALRLRRSNA
jgi:hypothetical protein